MAKAITQRISLEGSDELRKQFAELGRAIEQAFRQIGTEIAKIGEIKLPTDEAKKNLNELSTVSKDTFKGIEDDAKKTNVTIPSVEENKKQFTELATASKESFKEIEQAAAATKIETPGVEKAKTSFGDLAQVAKAAFGDVSAAANVAKRQIDNLTSGFSGLQKTLLGLGVVGGVLAFVVNQARNAANTINGIAEAAEKSKTSVNVYNQLDFMLQKMGFSAEESKKALAEFGGVITSTAEKITAWGTRPGHPGIFELGGELQEVRRGIIHISQESADANKNLAEFQKQAAESAAALAKVKAAGEQVLLARGSEVDADLPQRLIEFGRALEALPTKELKVAEATRVLGKSFGELFVEHLDTKGAEAAVARFRQLSLDLGTTATESAKEFKEALDKLKTAKQEFDFASKIGEAQKGIVFTPVLTAVLEEAATQLGNLTTLLRTNSGEIQKWATAIGVNAVKAAGDFFKILLGASDEDIGTKWLIGPTKALRDFLKLLGGATDAEIDTKWLITFRDTVVETFRAIATTVTDFLLPTFQGLGEAIQPIIDSINQALGTSLMPALVAVGVAVAGLMGPFTALGVLLAGVFFAPGPGMDKFRESLKDIGIDIQAIKEFATQAFKDLAKALSGEKVDRQWINDLAKGIKELPAIILGVVAAFTLLRAGAAGIGIVLSRAFGVEISGGAVLLTTAIAQLTGILPTLATVMVILAAASTVLFNGLRAIFLLLTASNPFVAAAIAIGVLIVAFADWKTVMEVVNGTLQFLGNVVSEAGRALSAFGDLVASVATFVKNNFIVIGIAIGGFLGALALIPGGIASLGRALAPLGAVLATAAAAFWRIAAPILAAAGAIEIFNDLAGRTGKVGEFEKKLQKTRTEMERAGKSDEEINAKIREMEIEFEKAGQKIPGHTEKIAAAWEAMIAKMAGGAGQVKETLEVTVGNFTRTGNQITIMPAKVEDAARKVEDSVKTIDDVFKRLDEAGKRRTFGDVFDLLEKGRTAPKVDPFKAWLNDVKRDLDELDRKVLESIKNFFKLLNPITSAGAAELPGGPGGPGAAGGPFDALATGATAAFQKIEQAAAALVTRLNEIFTTGLAAGSPVANAFDGLATAAEAAFLRIEETATALMTRLQEIFSAGAAAIEARFTELRDLVQSVFNELIEAIVTAVGTAVEKITTLIATLMEALATAAADATKRLNETIAAMQAAFDTALDAMTNSIANFATITIQALDAVLEKIKEVNNAVGAGGGGGTILAGLAGGGSTGTLVGAAEGEGGGTTIVRGGAITQQQLLQREAAEKQREAAEKQREAAQKQREAAERQRDAAEEQREAAERQRDAGERIGAQRMKGEAAFNKAALSMIEKFFPDLLPFFDQLALPAIDITAPGGVMNAWIAWATEMRDLLRGMSSGLRTPEGGVRLDPNILLQHPDLTPPRRLPPETGRDPNKRTEAEAETLVTGLETFETVVGSITSAITSTTDELKDAGTGIDGFKEGLTQFASLTQEADHDAIAEAQRRLNEWNERNNENLREFERLRRELLRSKDPGFHPEELLGDDSDEDTVGQMRDKLRDTMTLFASNISDISNAFSQSSDGLDTLHDGLNEFNQNLTQFASLDSGGGSATAAAGGGLLGGRGSGTSDSNLAWVSRGEYITPAKAVRQPGVLAFLEALRQSGGNLRRVLDGMGRFALGGLVPGALPAFAGGGSMSNVTIAFPGLPPIGGLRASSDVVEELRKAAVLAQVRSGGRKPSRYG